MSGHDSTSTALGRRRRDRVVLTVIGVALVVSALAVAVFAGGNNHDNRDRTLAVTGGGTRTVAVQLADMRITPKTIAVAVGTRLVLQVTNTDNVRHDLYIDGGPQTPLLAPGQSARLDIGTITHTLQGWCTVPGHKAAGMTMTITVAGTAASPSRAATMASMPGASRTGTDNAAPTIDFNASPGPDWKPYNPVLAPAPGANVHRETFTIRDTLTEVAPGIRQTLWTYNGTAPGPILHGNVGDVFHRDNRQRR
jgi:nitrite reductase (NO-forming)